MSVGAGKAPDLAGNANASSNTFTVMVDATPPVPLITGPASPTNVEPFTVTIAFGEMVTGFVSTDLTVAGGTAMALTHNGAGNYTATIDATGDGSVSVGVAAGKAADAAGNANAASNTFTVTVDTTAPVPRITGPANPANTDPLTVTIAFGEVVSDFVLAELTVTGGTATDLADNGGGSYTATIDATADGPVSVSVAAGQAMDGAGNANATSNTYTVTVDTVSPVPVITGPASLTNADPFTVTIAFGERVTGFVKGDVTVIGGTTTDLTDNGGGSYTVTIDTAVDGLVSVSVAAGQAADGAGNVNAASNTFTVTVDTTAPVPVIRGPASPTNADPFLVAITFGEVVTGFVLGDMTVIGGTATGLTDNGGGSFTATIDAAADGVVSVSVVAGQAVDLAGNANAASNMFTVTVDTAPTADIVDVSPDPRYLAVGLVTVAFSEAVFGVDISSFQLTRNGEDVKLDDLAVVRVDDAQYTLDLAAVTDKAGTYRLTLTAGPPHRILDATGHPLAGDASDVFVVTAQNWGNAHDVNNDARVTPLDALIIINCINRHGAGLAPIPPPTSSAPPLFLDVNNDGRVEPLDVLTVISFVNGPAANAGEAEGATVGLDLPSATSAANQGSELQVGLQSLKLRAAEFPRIRGDGGVPAATARIIGNSATLAPNAQLPRLRKDAELGEFLNPSEIEKFETLLDLLATDVAGVLRKT